MRIAIYLTNPQPEGFKAGDKHYGEMFEDMLQPHMGGTIFEHFDVASGEFPGDPNSFDGVVITGSAVFVTNGDPWIKKLFEHIRIIDRAGTKLFAVCFGHQAVAAAFGGVVEHRDIVLGAPRIDISEVCDWMQPALPSVRLFAGNFQQVVEAPDSLQVIGSHPDCPVAMTRKADHILTVQFHPELSAKDMRTYVDLIADDITAENAASALKSFEGGSDRDIFAKWAAGFLIN